MGVNVEFYNEFFEEIKLRFYGATWIELPPFKIVAVKDDVYVNLLSVKSSFTPQQLISLQTLHAQSGILLVHLWEDVWEQKKSQVLSRINSFCGLNQTLHARQAKILPVDAAQARDFLTLHHLQGFSKVKHHLGLTMGGELKALACFASSRPMKSKGAHYKSAELVRFATQSGFTLVGGLSKLIKSFLQEINANDLMTYADRDWSVGKGYDKLGFQLTAATAPVEFTVDTSAMTRYYTHRLPKKILTNFEAQNVLNLDEFLAQNGFVKTFNTGNLKYHLYTNV
ncbi:hypothetical protein [Pedobacter sp.]